jgi:predicted Zn-dependent protease
MPANRFLSQAECETLMQQVARYAVGGGDTEMVIESTWTGNLRWARNDITTSGDVRQHRIGIRRIIRGASAPVWINAIDALSLEGAVRRAESILRFRHESHESDTRSDDEPYLRPHLWFDATFNLDAEHRAAAMRELVQPTVAARMLAAGYLEVSAHGRAVLDSRGHVRYYPFTQAQYSVTVRDPQGTGSGWAGVDWSDWARVDATHLSAVALEKCLRSRNPVAVEPGRYTTILEPQAVADLFTPVIASLDRSNAENGRGPFAGTERGTSKIGEHLLDARITVSADPMDPDLGFAPFSYSGMPFNPAVWFDRGVLTNLSYFRGYAIVNLAKNRGLPNSGAFRMSGGATSIDEMIATTERGLLVTRLSQVSVADPRSLMLTGYTRDGLWLIEHGALSKPVKNFRFAESPLFVFNQVEQLGMPQRVFHPIAPAVCPPVKVRDFNFLSLADAV